MSTGEWACLISFARAPPTCNEGKQAKNSKWKYMSPPDIEPATLWFLAGHLDRLYFYSCNKAINFRGKFTPEMVIKLFLWFRYQINWASLFRTVSWNLVIHSISFERCTSRNGVPTLFECHYICFIVSHTKYFINLFICPQILGGSFRPVNGQIKRRVILGGKVERICVFGKDYTYDCGISS